MHSALSIVAAISHFSQYAISLSPTLDRAENSCELLPPIGPLSASTILKSRPHLENVLTYASYCNLYATSRSSGVLSNEYASFMMNSRDLIKPYLGRASSRYLNWM